MYDKGTLLPNRKRTRSGKALEVQGGVGDVTDDNGLRHLRRKERKADFERDRRWDAARCWHPGSNHARARQFAEVQMLSQLATDLLATESDESVTMIVEALQKSDPLVPGKDFTRCAAERVVELAKARLVL